MYSVILADPPWQFKTWSEKGNGRGAVQHYPTMTIEEICGLPVSRLAQPNCVLFLWCVWPSIFQAGQVMESWGFTYRTCGFVWVKAKQSREGFHIGLGYYTRANSEPCLIGVRGTMPVATHDVSQIVYAPVGRHSAKPEEVQDRIERLYPDRRYLELFARRERQGWDVWGNQVESSIDLPALASGG